MRTSFDRKRSREQNLRTPPSSNRTNYSESKTTGYGTPSTPDTKKRKSDQSDDDHASLLL